MTCERKVFKKQYNIINRVYVVDYQSQSPYSKFAWNKEKKVKSENSVGQEIYPTLNQ